jgi:glycosyltransferase involved in cell wall biosynthesis
MALHAAGVPTHAEELTSGGPYRRREEFSKLASSNGHIYGVSVFHINADETPTVHETDSCRFRMDSYNIGYWAWELEAFPDRFLPSFAYYQEIWTPSSFCQAAIARKSPIPVERIPHAVEVRRPEGMDRSHFGLRDSEFVFLTMFDMLSVFERKNPLAVVRAFARAFEPGARERLVVKVNNAEHGTRYLEQLVDVARGYNIDIIDSTLNRDEVPALTGCCDCLVSLHRSEGFGLTMAEAMYLGKPVIATGYSGNLDFTSPDNSLLVSYRLRPVGKGCDPYPEEAMWAEPDEDEASRHMVELVRNRDLRLRLAGAGQEWVREHLSPATVGRMMRKNLVRLWQNAEGQAAAQ